MIDGVSIGPKAVYGEPALSVALDVSVESLSRARHAGELRHTGKGRGILYLSQWILEWLEFDSSTEGSDG